MTDSCRFEVSLSIIDTALHETTCKEQKMVKHNFVLWACASDMEVAHFER